ncbi:MAG: GNAT family N-acetyltransferase [Candidatus Altiarchaeales archaeon]|nr:GNAT family N-acetyltransferase [Candidatus Altiarchaeales archaeon]MBD3416365.1 GNAT family N-acetyltransferase [Candidatus Altiarchaeales archaeon]
MESAYAMPGLENMRLCMAEDLEQIREVMVESGVFSEFEVLNLMDMIGEYVGDVSGDLMTYCYVIEGHVGGFISFGTGLGVGTYEVYWICVSPKHSGNGIGTALVRFAEEYIRGRRGRAIFIETSSSRGYEGARRLYEKMGYDLAARVEDYYNEGDHKLVYLKKL